MANIKPEGIFPCTILGGRAGLVDGRPIAQITARLDEGPAAGQVCTYEDDLVGKSALYTRRSMAAVGWSGQTARTFEEDVKAWIAKTGGRSTVEIKHLEIKKGKNAGKIWDKVNSIGRGAARELAPLTDDLLADADAALHEAAALDGASVSTRPSDDDLPF